MMSRMLAPLLTAALTTAALPLGCAHAATIVATGVFGVDEDTNVGVHVDEGPGHYRFALDLSNAPEDVFGDTIKSINFNFYCNFHDGHGVVSCGGDDAPMYYPFKAVSPTRYEALVEVLPLRSIPDGFGGREDDLDLCCNVQLDIYATSTGRYTLSVASVPEPSSWALMIAGLGVAGAAMRRRGRAIAAVARRAVAEAHLRLVTMPRRT